MSYVSSDRKPYLPNRLPFSKQKLDGITLNTKIKHIPFISLLSPSTSCIACFLFQEASPLACSAPLTPKLVKFTGPASVQGEAQESFLTFRFIFILKDRYTANLHLVHIKNTPQLLSQQEKSNDVDPFAVPVEHPVTRLNFEGSVLSTGNEADDDTVDVEL